MALLVIDMLGNPYASPVSELAVPATENGARICTAARENGVPVIFCDDAHISGLDRELELWGDHALIGTPEAQPSPQLGLCDDDFIIEKRRYSAFFQTGLRLLLHELGVDTVIAIGADTNICVRHTVADAFFNNLNSIIVTDATWTYLVGNQEDGLAYCQTCYGSKLVDTDAAVSMLNGLCRQRD
jgi:nicotinamidase-related amidase